jgi:lipopolysaccharide transport system permease protein
VSQRWEVTASPQGPVAAIADAWNHRRLLRFVGDRALRKIYRRTVLGWLWLFITPLFPLALRALIFGALLGVASNGLPYFLFLLAGTVVWDTFAMTLLWGTRSLEMNRQLTEQIHMPRTLMPIGNIAPALLDLVIKLAVFVLALAYYAARHDRLYLRTDAGLLWAGAALALALFFALGLSLFTSVWGESTRDMRFALGQVLSIWYLLTPVLYPLSAVSEAHRGWMLLNPMAIIAETFKWGLFGVGVFDGRALAAAAGGVLVLTLAGFLYFTRAESRAIEER